MLTLKWLVAAVLFMALPAHLMWALERDQSDGIVSRAYIPGIFQAMFWAMSTLFTQAEAVPRRALSRRVAVLWMFFAVIFVAFYTADVAANLTIDQIRGVINGPDDLRGKRVATLKGSTSAEYLRERDIEVAEFPQTEAMLEALVGERVDAVLFSAPTLRYYAAHAYTGRLVGAEFQKHDLSFVVPIDSPLRRRLNAALLTLEEDGTYERIYVKWFGIN